MTKTFYFLLNMYPILLNFMLIFMMSLPMLSKTPNPINLILILIIMTSIISLKLNTIMNSWNSFILFLVIIGGLMIIFMYIISLLSNEPPFFNWLNLFNNLLKLFMLITLLFFFLFMNLKFNQNYLINFNQFLNLNFYEMFFKFYNFNTIFIMTYLFFSMICVMNICYKFKSPLRQLFI